MTKDLAKPYKPGGHDPRIILHRSVFFTLTHDEKRHLMQYWRENYTTNDIMKAMGYNNSTSLYKAIRRLGLPTDLRRHKQQLLKQEYEHLGTMPRGVREVIANVGKDTDEPKTPTVIKPKEGSTSNNVISDDNHVINDNIEEHLNEPLQELQKENIEDKLEEVKNEQVSEEVTEKITVEKDDAIMAYNLPIVKVELQGEISLAEIQKVIDFAQQMDLEIKVLG